MGVLAEKIVKTGLGTIMKAIYDRKPVSDPSICCMAVGDAYSDQAPLQVTQFESSVAPLVDQVSTIWLEGNGGGNGGESYPLAWLFTAAKTKCDAIKRGRKGFLFTIGDETFHPTIERSVMKDRMGIDYESDIEAKPLYENLSKDWEIFHLITETATTGFQNAVGKWRELLGERAIVIPDIDKMAEGIVSLLELIGGKRDKADIVRSFDEPTRVVVRHVMGQISA